MKKQLLFSLLSAVLFIGSFPLAAKKITSKEGNTLKGLSISILGDSYSTYGGYIPQGNYTWYAIDGVDGQNEGANDITSVKQTWWHLLCNTYSLILDTNNSFSGSTVCNTGYDAKDVTTTSFLARMSQIGNPNILLIFGATNDNWAGSPLGDFKYSQWSQEDLKAYRPALANLLDWLQTHKPGMRIFFVLNCGLREDIIESTSTICAHYHIPLLQLQDISVSHGHPNQAGMRAIADQIGEFLKVHY